jgi:hypothetical protein
MTCLDTTFRSTLLNSKTLFLWDEFISIKRLRQKTETHIPETLIPEKHIPETYMYLCTIYHTNNISANGAGYNIHSIIFISFENKNVKPVVRTPMFVSVKQCEVRTKGGLWSPADIIASLLSHMHCPVPIEGFPRNVHLRILFCILFWRI